MQPKDDNFIYTSLYIWLMQHLGILIDCLLFQLKLVTIILQDFVLVSVISQQ